MQPSLRIKNKNTVWVDKLRPRVGDTVVSGGVYYSNLTGYNGPVSNATIWFPIGSQTGGSPVPITLTAANVEGSDPFYYVDLSTYSVLPALPSSILVYIDIAGDGNFKTLSPIDYNASTKVLNGMNSPIDFPDQIIKIFIV